MLDFLIHPEIRNPSHPDYRKAQIASFLLFVIFIALLFYSAYFLVYKFQDTVKNSTNLLGLVFIIGSLVLMRLSKSVIPALTILLFFSLIATSTSIYHTGGIYSVDISWFLLTVVTSCFFLNVRSGIAFFVAAAGYVFYLYYIENQGNTNKFFSEYPNINNTTHYVFTWIFVMLFLLIIIISFLKTLEKANKKIEAMQKNKVEELRQLVEEKNKEIHKLRSKLAQDFHDEVSNKLAGIRMISETIAFKSNHNLLEKTDMIASLQTIENRSKELYQGTKDFIWSISDRSDKISELFTYISDQLNLYFNAKNIEFQSEIVLEKSSENTIDPSISRQLIVIINDFSVIMASEYAISKSKIDFIEKNNNLTILLQYKSAKISTETDYKTLLEKNKNRLTRIEAKRSLKIKDNEILYTFSISLEPKEHTVFQ